MAEQRPITQQRVRAVPKSIIAPRKTVEPRTVEISKITEPKTVTFSEDCLKPISGAELKNYVLTQKPRAYCDFRYYTELYRAAPTPYEKLFGESVEYDGYRFYIGEIINIGPGKPAKVMNLYKTEYHYSLQNINADEQSESLAITRKDTIRIDDVRKNRHTKVYQNYDLLTSYHILRNRKVCPQVSSFAKKAVVDTFDDWYTYAINSFDTESLATFLVYLLGNAHIMGIPVDESIITRGLIEFDKKGVERDTIKWLTLHIQNISARVKNNLLKLDNTTLSTSGSKYVLATKYGHEYLIRQGM